MTRTFYILLIFLVLSACSNSNDTKPNAQQAEVVIPTEKKEPELVPIKLSTEEALEHIRKLVEEYSSVKRHEYPDSELLTRDALIELRASQPDSLDHLLAWLFSKKYRFHLECCNQGYELRSLRDYSDQSIGIDSIADTWVFEMLRSSRLIELNDIVNGPYEFMNSGIITQWLDKNPELVKLEVKEEKAQIDSLINRIEKGLPWN